MLAMTPGTNPIALKVRSLAPEMNSVTAATATMVLMNCRLTERSCDAPRVDVGADVAVAAETANRAK